MEEAHRSVQHGAKISSASAQKITGRLRLAITASREEVEGLGYGVNLQR
jgi:hypothetical protein